MDDWDWDAWSADAVSMMNSRNRAWIDRYHLTGAPYFWDLKIATIAFDGTSSRVVADLCLVGTASKVEGSFLWAWANETIPADAKRDLEKVRAFGMEHALGMLITPELPGGRAEGLEALAIAGRVLNADGVWTSIESREIRDHSYISWFSSDVFERSGVCHQEISLEVSAVADGEASGAHIVVQCDILAGNDGTYQRRRVD